jgi:hypothetical protein
VVADPERPMMAVRMGAMMTDSVMQLIVLYYCF